MNYRIIFHTTGKVLLVWPKPNKLTSKAKTSGEAGGLVGLPAYAFWQALRI